MNDCNLTKHNLHRYVFKIEYDGTKFDSGWQEQNIQKTSVQGALVAAAKSLSGETVKFVAAGRTDKNVHALGQIVHADFAKRHTNKVLIEGMNWYLKGTGCRVLQVHQPTDPTFHARFSAKHKTYEYVIAHTRVCSVFDENRTWWIRDTVKLDLDLFHKGIEILTGEHDFSSFRDASCQAVSPIRKVDSIELRHEQHKMILTFKARSFLHKQIRIMTGTLVDVARGRLNDMQAILEARDRNIAGQTAPGCGLYLKEVSYAL